MEAFGAPPEVIEQARAAIQARAEPFGIWPENWRAVQVFCALGTQWRMVAGPGGVIWMGFPYEVLPIVEARVPPTPDVPLPDPALLFSQLRVLETTALSILNQPRN